MSAALRPPFGSMVLPMAGLIVVLYLAGCALLGWKVGGAPPGWYEGKFLAGPLWLGAGLSAVGLLALLAVATVDLIRFRRAGGSLRFRDWLPVGATATFCLAMIASFWVPWGIIIVYRVSHLRWAANGM